MNSHQFFRERERERERWRERKRETPKVKGSNAEEAVDCAKGPADIRGNKLYYDMRIEDCIVVMDVSGI